MVLAFSSAEETRSAHTNLPSSGKDDGKTAIPPSNRFATALCGVLGDSAIGSTLAGALLLSHHPVVCHSVKGARSLWKGIERRAYGGVEGIEHLLQDNDIVADIATRIAKAMQDPVVYGR